MAFNTPQQAKILDELNELTTFTSADKLLITNNSTTYKATFQSMYNNLKTLFGVGAGIVEEGTNSNGNYIKFSNGLMICTGVSAQRSGTFYNYINYGDGHVHYAAEFICNYAAAFIASPYVVTRAKNIGNHGYWTGQHGDAYFTTTSSKWFVWSYAPGSYTNLSVQYIAIGRWQ